MNFHSFYAKAGHPVETCVVGTGGFGRSFLSHARFMPLVNCRVAVDVDAAAAAEGLRGAGIAPDAIRICETPADAVAAWREGRCIATHDLAVALELPVAHVVEATGSPQAGARHALMAIEAGRDVALVSKEVDSVVGPGLARIAAERGAIVTPVDGDQPSLLIALVSWAEVLGFDIVAAGKSSEYDFVFDRATGQMSCDGRILAMPRMAECWMLGERDAAACVAERSRIAAALPQRAVPDLCEMQIVANATGLEPDRADFHVPIARIAEVPTLFATHADGGLLAGERRLDVFHCLRAPDEASFAGGVFVVVRARDETSWAMLAGKGHVVSRSGATAMLYLPRHILGLEAATSILDAAVHRLSGYGSDYRPRQELVAVASRPLQAGDVLAMGGHHHTIDGATAALRPAAALAADQPAPFYLCAGHTLARAVPQGATIVLGDLMIDPDSSLMAIRRRQDALFA